MDGNEAKKTDRDVSGNAKHDRAKCRVCGHHWEPFKDEQGRIYAGHPYGETCSRYRPAGDAEVVQVFLTTSGRSQQ